MSGTRLAVIFGSIPIVVAIIYLALQLTFGDQTEWFSANGEIVNEAGDFVANIAGTADPAGVILLLSLGIAMAFGFAVILRGARDL